MLCVVGRGGGDTVMNQIVIPIESAAISIHGFSSFFIRRT